MTETSVVMSRNELERVRYQLRSSLSGLLVSPLESEDVNDSRRGTNAEAEGLLFGLAVSSKEGNRAGVLVVAQRKLYGSIDSLAKAKKRL